MFQKSYPNWRQNFLKNYDLQNFKTYVVNCSKKEEDKVYECFSCLELMIQTHLHVGIFTKFFIKHVSLKLFY